MWPLERICSVGGASTCAAAVVFAIGLAIAAERLWSLLVRLSVNSAAFMGQIEKLLEVGNLDRAVKLCAAAGGAALPRVVRAGLESADGDERAVKAAMDEVAAEIAPMLSRRFGPLSGLAAATALIGLVGAAVGLRQALGAFDARSLTEGIAFFTERASMSLFSAAFGLGGAAVLVVAKVLLSATASRISGEIAHQSIRVQNLLAKRRAERSAG